MLSSTHRSARARRVRRTLLGAVIALVTGCGTSSPAPGQTQEADAVRTAHPEIPQEALPVPFTPIPEVTRAYSPFEEGETRVIRSSAEWSGFLTEMGGPDGPPAEGPSVDFATESVLVVALGFRSSGGYAVGMEGVYRVGDELLVAALETRPDAGCMTSAALTMPVTAVRVPAHAGPVRFLHRAVDQPCS